MNFRTVVIYSFALTVAVGLMVTSIANNGPKQSPAHAQTTQTRQEIFKSERFKVTDWISTSGETIYNLTDTKTNASYLVVRGHGSENPIAISISNTDVKELVDALKRSNELQTEALQLMKEQLELSKKAYSKIGQ